MGAPATQVYPTFLNQAGETGAIREYWVKITGLIGSTSGNNGVQNVVQNPFPEDMVIWEAFIVITAASQSNNGEYDIGLGDSAAGGTNGVELADTMTNATTAVLGVKDLGLVHAKTTPPVKPIWKNPKTSTTVDSWLVFDQDGSVDISSFRFNCFLKLVPYADLI